MVVFKFTRRTLQASNNLSFSNVRAVRNALDDFLSSVARAAIRLKNIVKTLDSTGLVLIHRFLDHARDVGQQNTLV